jgi:Plavaka transposase
VHHQFVRLQTSENNTDISLDLLKAVVIKANGDLKFPWLSTKKMYETIDQIQAGPALFRSYYFQYNGPMLPTPPKWMTQTYKLYARDPQLVLQQQLATPEFADKFTPTPYRQFQSDGQRVFSNLMPGDWA